MANGADTADDTQRKSAEGRVREDEMRTINERLVIAGVRQQEFAEKAQEAERRTANALEQMKEAHDDLHATHDHLQSTHAVIQAAYKAIQTAYEREHHIAQVLQRPLTLEVPEDAFPGLSVATLYSAAWDEAEVGGDFYDAVALPNGWAAFFVGDASGKGLAAAARAMEIKDVLRAYLRLGPFYPATTLTRVNDYLCNAQTPEEREAGTFVALCLVIVSVDRSEALFAWAGIEAPILVRADNTVERLDGTGLPLGVTKGQHYADVLMSFRPGETVLLSTDGLSEARRGKDFLDPEGVEELVRGALAEPTLRDVGASVLAGAREYAGGRLTDDACLVLVRRL